MLVVIVINKLSINSLVVETWRLQHNHALLGGSSRGSDRKTIYIKIILFLPLLLTVSTYTNIHVKFLYIKITYIYRSHSLPGGPVNQSVRVYSSNHSCFFSNSVFRSVFFYLLKIIETILTNLGIL